MNTPNTAQDSDPEIGDVTSHNLPTAFLAGNQSLAVSMAMAEVDQQITTAHAFPRSIDRAVKNILTLATLDEASAKECIYAVPRDGKAIRGPSIRLAEIIQSQWGNNRVGTRVVHVDRIEKYVEAEGVFHDLETNSATTARVRRRLSNKRGELLTEDMIITTGNAASSIAKRNAILGGVPKAVWRKAYAEVERVIVGDVKTMTEKRDDAMKAFAAFGVTPERLFVALGIVGADDITVEHYLNLIGMHQAIRNGEATVEEMFPLPKADNGEKKSTDIKDRLDELAGDKPKQEATAKPAAAKTQPKQAEQKHPKPANDQSELAGKQVEDAQVDEPSFTRDEGFDPETGEVAEETQTQVVERDPSDTLTLLEGRLEGAVGALDVEEIWNEMDLSSVFTHLPDAESWIGMAKKIRDRFLNKIKNPKAGK